MHTCRSICKPIHTCTQTQYKDLIMTFSASVPSGPECVFTTTYHKITAPVIACKHKTESELS